IALLGQDVDSDTADATSSASDQNRPLLGPGAVAFHSEEAHGRSESGCAQGHGFECRQRGRGTHHPACWYPDVFGIATKGAAAQVVTGNEDTVTYGDIRGLTLDYRPGGINARHVWVLPDDATLPSGGEGVFVVEGGIFDGNRDLSGRELIGSECGNLPLDPL